MGIKNIICIVTVFLSSSLDAQKSISEREFLPDLFYTKQSLVDHYQYNDLNYKAMMFDLESKSDQNVKILLQDSSRIIYTYSYRDKLAVDTISLRFNSDKKLTEWTSNNNECNDRSSDIPQPIISSSFLTYDPSGHIKRIEGFCADTSYSIRTDFYYNAVNELDSIIYSYGYSELYIYRKIILVNSTVWSGEEGSSMVLILNTPLDYVSWLKDNLYDTAYFGSTKNRLQNSYNRFTKNIDDDNNYIYEFDSVGRVTSYAALNVKAEYSAVPCTTGCNLCDSNCAYPVKLEIYYVGNKISGIAFYSFGSADSELNCRCDCLMHINYKKEKIKEITFHSRLSENEFVLEKTWTPKKGFQNINGTSNNSK